MSSSEPLLSRHEEQRHLRVRFQDDVTAGFPRTFFPTFRGVVIWTRKQIVGINVLLLLLPLGWTAYLLDWDARLVSALNLLPILPLSAIVSEAAGALFAPLGPLVSALINATLGNAVELIVGFLAIRHGEIGVAQATMLGSILSDILFVLGACLIASARTTGLPKFNEGVSDALSSLMVVTAVALILPTVLYSTFQNTTDMEDKILTFSRLTSGVLLLVYVFYLYFQLKTHTNVFLDEEEDAEGPDHDPEDGEGAGQPRDEDGPEAETDERPDESPSGGPYTASLVLLVSIASIVACAHNFVESIEPTSKLAHITKTFIAAILVPIASNAPECSEVVSASRKRRINFAIGVIVGSILQIALFVLPILVLVGWAVGEPMTLYFETSQTCVLFLAVLMVNNLLQDDHYSYFHGVMLLAMYFIIALAYFIRTDRDLTWKLSTR